MRNIIRVLHKGSNPSLNLHDYDKLLALQVPTPEQKLCISHCSASQSTHHSTQQSPYHNDYQLSVKRDDLLHPIISGNKWRKIHYHLLRAQQQRTQHIISFGGGYSNHLHALAYCCKQLGIRFSAIVRGDYSQNLTPMLKDLIEWGSEVQYVTKVIYKTRDSALKAELAAHYPDAMIIPEGGSSDLALKGVAQITHELSRPYDYILLPVASGATMAGVISGIQQRQLSAQTQVIGIGVLKGQGYLEQLVSGLLPTPASSVNWHINHNYHFGGYAKQPQPLLDFCQHFSAQHQLPIEPIYSGKLFYAIEELMREGFLAEEAIFWPCTQVAYKAPECEVLAT